MYESKDFIVKQATMFLYHSNSKISFYHSRNYPKYRLLYVRKHKLNNRQHDTFKWAIEALNTLLITSNVHSVK